MYAPAATRRSWKHSERRAKEGAGVSKRDVQKYLKKQQQQNDEPVNNAFAQHCEDLS